MEPKMIRLFSLLAVFLCLSAFSIVAYAQTDEDIGEVITGIVYSDPAEVEEEIEAEEPQSLNPEGNMSLVDDIDGEAAEDKQFITVVSKNGNYFYIIIDRAADGENTVHFLNQVDEADLMALMDEEAAAEPEEMAAVCICTVKCAAGSVNTACAVCKLDMTQCCGEEPATEPEPTSPPAGEDVSGDTPRGNGAFILVLLLALVGGGAAYYFKIYKPKQPKGNADFDDYDFGGDEEDDDVLEANDEVEPGTDNEDSEG